MSAEATRSTVLDELVFVGRSDGADVDRPILKLAVLPEAESDDPDLSMPQRIARVAALAVVVVSIVLAIALGLSYAA